MASTGVMTMKYTIRDIEEGDHVRDAIDGELKKVVQIESTTIFLSDGGCMGADDVIDLLLPSEVE